MRGRHHGNRSDGGRPDGNGGSDFGWDNPNGHSDPLQQSKSDLVSGILDVGNQGFGYLRDPAKNCRIGKDDVYVGKHLIQRYRIRTGHLVSGVLSHGRNQRGRGPALHEIRTVDGDPPGAVGHRPYYRDLTSIDPVERFRLGEHKSDISMRLVDLLTPIGKGQRGLVVAPPRTGKTILLQKMSQAIIHTHPDTKVLVLLVDERPEEVTDWKRNTQGEVYSSSSDEDSATHVRVAEIVLQRCQRLLEGGHHVVLLLDSLTRLGRAYNLETEHSGRTLSGGVDARTLEKPKAIFGAARNVEAGGSLTIIATALIETGSRMDEVIFEEFKGTGNMELVLSRKLADMRVFPAIDVSLSGTRKEEKLYAPEELEQIWKLRRVLNKVSPIEGMQLLKERVETFSDNREFLFSFS